MYDEPIAVRQAAILFKVNGRTWAGLLMPRLLRNLRNGNGFTY